MSEFLNFDNLAEVEELLEDYTDQPIPYEVVQW